jgi:hypothetical protein
MWAAVGTMMVVHEILRWVASSLAADSEGRRASSYWLVAGALAALIPT